MIHIYYNIHAIPDVTFFNQNTQALVIAIITGLVNLNSVILTVRYDNGRGGTPERHIDITPTIFALVSLKNLRSLEIKVTYREGSVQLDSTVAREAAISLETLKLGGMKGASQDGLIALIEGASLTIQELEVPRHYSWSFPDASTYPKLRSLTWIQNHPSLYTFETR